MLSKREFLLTQICMISKQSKDVFTEECLKQLPVISEIMGYGLVIPEEIFNLILELEIFRTEVAIKTYMKVRKSSDSNFQVGNQEGCWFKGNLDRYSLAIKVYVSRYPPPEEFQDVFNRTWFESYFQDSFVVVIEEDKFSESINQTVKFLEKFFDPKELENITQFLLKKKK